MIEDLLLHLRRVVRAAKITREPTIAPVTISRGKSHAGFDGSPRLGPSSRGLCFELSPVWLFAGGGGAPVTGT